MTDLVVALSIYFGTMATFVGVAWYLWMWPK